MRIGSFASAIAVFISTPSQPSSIAIAASAIAAQLPTLLAEEEPIYPLTDEEWEGEEEQGMESTAATELSLTPSPGSTRAPSVVQSGAAGAWMTAPGDEESGEEAPPAAAPAAAASSLMAIADDDARRFSLSNPLAA